MTELNDMQSWRQGYADGLETAAAVLAIWVEGSIQITDPARRDDYIRLCQKSMKDMAEAKRQGVQ